MRRVHVLWALALVMVTPVVSGWGVGDLSEEVDPRYADYAIRPLGLSPGVERGLGMAAAGVAVVAGGALVLATRRRQIDRRWWAAIVPLLLIGVYCGVSYRVVTAAVIGANIGAGMMFLLAPFVLIPLAGWSVAAAARTHCRD
jgi:hypothetical protein